jgi:hypothetical protein
MIIYVSRCFEMFVQLVIFEDRRNFLTKTFFHSPLFHNILLPRICDQKVVCVGK